MKRAWVAILFAGFAATALAVPQAVVDAVQAPAWRDRDGRAEPLAPGMALQSRDRIRTGPGSRVYLRLADGSTVKLGENGALLAERLGPRERRFFSAALDVARGAFRFTTDRLAKLSRRDISIRVSTVTAGIRGTDVWGKTEPERDFVCLLEGQISVSHRDGDVREMNEPLTFYVAPRGQPPGGIEKAEAEQVKKWAAETDIAPGGGAIRRGGKWKLLLGRAPAAQEALALYDRLRQAGYAASIRPREADAALSYDVLLGGFASRSEAAALAERIRREAGVEGRPVL